MRLPKGVKRGVKDEFDVEKMELKVRQQEEEIISLKRRIAELRFYALPKDEVESVERICSMIGLSLFGRQRYIFIEEYMKQRDLDEEEKLNQMYESGDLPF